MRVTKLAMQAKAAEGGRSRRVFGRALAVAAAEGEGGRSRRGGAVPWRQRQLCQGGGGHGGKERGSCTTVLHDKSAGAP